MIADLLADGFEVHYYGSATIGGSGRARLHDRVGDLENMVWEALAGAGWVGEMATLRTTVALRMGVPPAPAGASTVCRRGEPLPGRARRLGEMGPLDDRGAAWQQRVGPLNDRAAGRGYRLLESERRPDDLEFGEDMLYTAAVQAGPLTGAPDEVVEVGDVRIAVSVAHRNARWEAFASGTADPGAAPPARRRDRRARARGAGPRGRRSLRRPEPGADPTRPRGADPTDEQAASYPFQTVVVDIETGQITDSGSSNQAPDLTPLGEIVTDHASRCA